MTVIKMFLICPPKNLFHIVTVKLNLVVCSNIIFEDPVMQGRVLYSYKE